MSHGSKVILKGDPSLGRSQASGKVALNALRDNEEGFLVTPLFRSDNTEEYPAILEATLGYHCDYFGVRFLTGILVVFMVLEDITFGSTDKCTHPQAHQAFIKLDKAFKELQDP